MASTCHQPEIEIVNAFHGLAPPFPPASASASTPATSPFEKSGYDVFINHRGPDVKSELATEIYKALYAMGLKVFLDSQDLDLGDFFPIELQHAMSTSSLHIAIFSPTYAKSPWCLAELCFMLNTGTPIIPVFYQVEPAHLRHLTGLYRTFFEEYEKNGRYTDKLQEWKTALYNASFYEGEIINNNEEEQKQRVLKNIVNRVLKIMKSVPLEVATHPVGLEEAVADFEMTITKSATTHFDVQIVGIWGMGGSGKTTLAKELYNKKKLSVKKSSFVFDIKSAATKKELHIKQRQLLEDLGYEFKNQTFDNIDQGKMILYNYLRSLPVFVVLDDVDHGDQLEILLPGKGTLAPGSLIIITTRDKEVLNAQGISCIFKMKSMNPSHAKQLFCWHAFLQSSPLLGFENLVEKFINACNGLPLSLKLLGGQLYRCSNKDLWKDLLHKISRILPDDIINRLRVSYDALDKEEQQMFLDVPCFFIGHDKMIAIAVWEEAGWSGQWGWERLVNKCLVELVDGNKIRMHDHLRDLGREIASTVAPHRLWSPNQLMMINKEQQIRGMILNATTSGIHKLPNSLLNTSTWLCGFKIARRPFPHGLKIFVIGENFVNNLHIARLSRELAWLMCTKIAHKNLPSWMPLTNLRVLELYDCREIVSLWTDGVEAPVHLRVLIVSKCSKLKRIPKSIGYLKHLKKICIDYGWNVKNLPEEFCYLQSLQHLQLRRFRELLSLPSCFGHLTNLQHLDLSRCTRLRMLPDSFKQLTLLQHLNLYNCRELSLQPDILENVTRVHHLNLTCCRQLEELPRDITNQASLSELYLRKTKLTDLPINIGNLSKLRVMKIMPRKGCFQMRSLPESMGNLTLLQKLKLHNLEVQTLPESMGSLTLLEELELKYLKLQSLPKSFKQLISLQVLNIHDCPIDDLGFGQTFLGSNLKTIELRRTRVSKITISDGCCPHLRNLQLRYNEHLTVMDSLPTSVEDIYIIGCGLLRNMSVIGGLVSLRYLRLEHCPELEMLPRFGKLASLKEFRLKGGNKVEKIEGLEGCTSLERLSIDGGKCWDVSGTESSEQLQRLKHVKLVAKKRSTLLPCIQMIQKLPKEMIICTKARADAGSLLKSSAFPDLSEVQFFAKEEFEKRFKSFSDVKAMIVCYVVKCNSPTSLEIKSCECKSLAGCSELEEGKWVLMVAFTSFSKKSFYPRRVNCETEWETVGVGDDGSVVKAFHRLFTLLSG